MENDILYYNEFALQCFLEREPARTMKWENGKAVQGRQGEARSFKTTSGSYMERTYWVRLRGANADTVQVTAVVKEGEPSCLTGFRTGQELVLTVSLRGSRKDGSCGLPRIRVLAARLATEDDLVLFRPFKRTAEQDASGVVVE